MLEDALTYARAGEEVLPVVPCGKNPATEHGFYDATADPERIATLWRMNSNYNIGIRPPLGIVVLDVDVQNGGAKEDLGALPPTRVARTGSGGYHLWFRYRGPVRGALADAVGIDIKSNNGYVIVPPSVHKSGRRYEWISRAPIAMLPTHLRPRVAKPKPPRRRVSVELTSSDTWVAGLVRTVAEAAPGNRNHLLFWAACRVVERGADPAVMDLLRAAAATVGLSGGEIERTVNSAERRRA
ncbi:bifunctional DNA primase/polymerase [Nocardia sp. R7R-8]|uniref:bifunctional DNA primase/polymerase n=1 Tax=Nocardia sp. R7R-8 TaxID=3459304 RepID=UPI00403DB6AB